jgi:hypothetical protein
MHAILYEKNGEFRLESFSNYTEEQIMNNIESGSRYYVVTDGYFPVSNNPVPPSSFDDFFIYWPNIYQMDNIKVKS